MTTGELLMLAATLGLIPAAIARRKGDGFFWWWVFGALLFPIALIVSVTMRDKRPRCPWCDEPVSGRARVCPHCQRKIAAAAV